MKSPQKSTPGKEKRMKITISGFDEKRKEYLVGLI